MQFFKVVFAFLSVGGATYAFIKLNETPPWLKLVSIVMAVAALIVALPELPRGIDAIQESTKKIAQMLPSLPRIPVAISVPSNPNYVPSTPYVPEPQTYTPPQTISPPVQTYSPPVQTYVPPPPKCAALVMSTGGGWGVSAGFGSSCDEDLERARSTCNSYAASGTCGTYATSNGWVAGVYCLEQMRSGKRWNSFAGLGSTESEAFERALTLAAGHSFNRRDCRRKVSLSAEGRNANRY
jgi:hypothetical protein